MEAMNEQQPVPDAGGRPTKYRTAFNKLAYSLALLGATDEIIAEALDITPSTLYEWKNKYTRFSEALRRGKIQADAEVASALHKRATGFSYDEVTFERIELGEDFTPTEKSPVKTNAYKKKVVTKYVPPDTGAATLWLKNRQKELWRDRHELGIDMLTESQVDSIFNRLINQHEKQ
jgi:transposase-like protein